MKTESRTYKLNVEKQKEDSNKVIFDTNAQCCDISNKIIQKEESMEEPKELLIVFTKDNNGDWIFTHKDYEIKEFDGKFKLVKKKPQYPKTYRECCEVLEKSYSYAFCGLPEDEYPLFDKFIELKRCRDAYWKIAGEEMGLGKPWEPDWIDSNLKHCIKAIGNKIECPSEMNIRCILAFPTEEIRDIFYENFKGLIEECKELL